MNTQPLSRRGFLTRSGLVLGTFAGSAVLASCNEAAKQAISSASGGGAAQRDVSLQLGWLVSEGQLGEAGALAKGYYADNGIKLSVQPGGPSIDGVSLVAGGRSQLGEVSSSPSLMLARSQGIPVKTFAVGVQEHPYAYISLPDKPVREPKDLIGKKVGTQATGQILLSALLAKNGIDPGDVEVVVIGADVTPLTTKQVDVWTGWLSNVTALRPLNDKFVSMRLWDAGIHLYGYPYYTTDTVLSEQKDMVQKWVAATAQGWADARKDLQSASADVVKLQPTLKAADVAAQGEVLLKYAFNKDTDADGWGTMSKEIWQSQLDTWTQLKQFKGAAPRSRTSPPSTSSTRPRTRGGPEATPQATRPHKGLSMTQATKTPAPVDHGNGAVTLDHVTVTFDTDRGRVTALQDVTVTLPEHGFVSLLGPSGCGKSTLLRVVADLLEPSSGTVTVLSGSSEQARKARELGFVFQDSALLPWRTALENVRLPLQVGGGARGDAESPEELLKLVGLQGRENAYPHELSGGMRQRVSIARALVCRPRILLMDEPFGALDEITRDRLNEELLRIWEATGTTILFVTHSIPESVFLSQQVLVLSAHPGRVRELVTIDLPYPRRLAVRDTPEFTAIAAHLRHQLETC